MVKDIFQDSVGEDNFFTSQAKPLENTLTRQPKVDFDLDGDCEVEDSAFADQLKIRSQKSGCSAGENRFSSGSVNKQQKSILRQTGSLTTSPIDQSTNGPTGATIDNEQSQKRRFV